ncbi:MAG: 50S ribosomal protein L11 methyltransferase, partial [Kiloniellales bacterium]
ARDWVAESQAALPAERIGRFHLYGAHNSAALPAGCLALRVEAAMAFGTGRHGSTAGCLTALTLLAKKRAHRRVLDLGCGTAVLAMAAAKLWPCAVLAVDNDPGSVLVARENLRANGLAAQIRVLYGDGLKPTAVRRAAPYDLILANILAGPLLAMARDLARCAAPGGSVILAGLLRRQERSLVARYRAAGLALVGTLRFGEWSTLILRRPSEARQRAQTRTATLASRRPGSDRDSGSGVSRPPEPPSRSGCGWPRAAAGC